MRTSHAATALAAFVAGLTAAATLPRLSGHRLTVTAALTTTAVPPTAVAVPDRDAVVLPFARPVLAGPAPQQSPEPRRCGDSGGLTKAGVPCGARATAGGRCHHHPIAA
jgi:hypothetical protein